MRARLVFRALLCAALFAGGAVSVGRPVHGQTQQIRVGFIGVWDRAEPMLDEVARAQGMTVAFWRPEDLLSPERGSNRAAAQACDLLFLLNLRPEQSVPLRNLLRQMVAAKPALKLVSLDKRDSQTDILKAGLMTQDEAIATYWRANGAVNLRRMLRYAAITFLHAEGTVEPPVIVPDFGYYDPDREEAFADLTSYQDFKRSRGRWIEGAPLAALIIQQSFWVTHDTKVVDAEVRALEKQRINPIVIFGDREAQVVDLLKATTPDLIVEDRHGSMWESRAVLEGLDAPYLRPISMLGYTIDEWRKDPAGLAKRDVNMFLTLQESWGTIEPVVVGGLVTNISGYHLHEPVADGIEKFARRARRIVDLRRKPNAEKKLALIYYNKGLGKDDLMRGSPTGAFLDAPASFEKFLPRLVDAGYTVKDAPASAAALIERMKVEGRNVAPWAPQDLDELVAKGHPVLIPLARYEQWFNSKLSPANRQAVIKAFGPPPGKLMTIQRGGQTFIVIPRIEMGNVILLPQPERGESQDDKLLHSRDVPPPHNYLAFYWWLDEEFKADAIVHWGTHGTLELLPGKEAGLTRDSWGDICVGDLPVVNLWIMDNIAEATLSRRRSYATLIDHLPPPAVAAGLPEALRNLHDDVTKFRALEGGVLKEEYRKRIATVAREERVDEILGLRRGGPGALDKLFGDDEIERIDEYVQRLSEERTPLSLHVLGEPLAEADRAPYLVSILGRNFLDHLGEAAKPPSHLTTDADRRAWLRTTGQQLVAQVVIDGKPSSVRLTGDLEKDLEFARRELVRLQDTDQEIKGLLRGLDARYVVPGPGPEPIRNPDAAPGGRNLYALNPEEIPTRPSWALAVQLVDDLLRARHPKKIGLDLNGMDTMRDFGVMEAQILYLMGVRPVWDRNNLAIGIELIPRVELKRPRVDVFIAMGGQYKENFPTRVELIDKAVKLATSADEPDNYVRLGSLENARQLARGGMSGEQANQLATARIFGTKQGNMSGTNILYLIPRSGVWDKDRDVSDVYIDNMSWVYTEGAWGQKVDGLYKQAIQGTEMLVRNWSSNMTSQLSNHHAYEYLGGLSMAVKALTGREPEAFIADVRDPEGARMREFNEVLATTFKTELLNPNWVKGMKEHGYAGAGHAAELVKNTFGWSVSRDGAVTDGTWNEIYSVYVDDKFNLGVREWLEKDNPHALQEMAATMLEASRKGYWSADAETLHNLAQVYRDSVAKHGESNGLMSGGNRQLEEYAAAHAGAPGRTMTDAAPGAAAAPPAGGAPPSAPAPAAAPPPSSASAMSKVAGRVMAPVSQLPRTVAAAVRTPLALAMTSLAALGLLLTGFVRREGSL